MRVLVPGINGGVLAIVVNHRRMRVMNSEMPYYLDEAIANLGTTDEELAALLECTVDDMYEELVGGTSKLPTELLVKAYGEAGSQFIANCELIRTAWANDAKRLQQQDTLFNIARDMSAMWDMEHPWASEGERLAHRVGYFESVAPLFWELAAEVKLEGLAVPFDNEEEAMKYRLDDYKKLMGEDCPLEPCGWVIRVGKEYRLYKYEGAALQAAYDLTYALTEYDVQCYFDELDHYSWEMGEAVEYIENKGLREGRVSGYASSGSIPYVHDVTGLKEELGQDGWVNFLLSFGYGYTAHPAIPT